MKVDWNKPVQISMDLHEWITPDFTCPLDNVDTVDSGELDAILRGENYALLGAIALPHAPTPGGAK